MYTINMLILCWSLPQSECGSC